MPDIYLIPRSAVIQQRLGLVTGVYDYTLDEVGVLQDALPEQEVLRRYGHPAAVWVHHGAMKPNRCTTWEIARNPVNTNSILNAYLDYK